jgi:RNAse (barnase) inhibitor barstar
MANFVFIHSKTDLDRYEGFRIAHIDGSKTPTLKAFYEAIAQVLDFPDYFGYNLDSLDELLNDFDWLEDDRIVLYISNTDQFLAQEKNKDKKSDLLNILDATAEDWKWVDDEEGETSPMELVIAFDQNEKFQQYLEEEGYSYDVVS